MRHRRLLVSLLAIGLALMIAVPAADALNVAARGIKARPSAEYGDGAWGAGYYGCGVTVAVFDEGVDDKHPYLDGKVIAGVDTTETSTIWNMANGGNPQPIMGTHGTPVAGLAVSHAGTPFFEPANAPEYADDALVGIAPCAWMVDVQFHDLGSICVVVCVSSGSSFDDRVIAAFQWAIDNKDNDWGDNDPSNDGIDIITMSWSPYDQTKGDDPISKIVTKAVEAGIVVLGSAGNSGSLQEPDIGTPSGADGALAIANLENQRTIDRKDDTIMASSTWGPRTDDGDNDPYEELKPDVAAPGNGVRSTGASLADGREYSVVCLGPDDLMGSSLPYQCEESFGGTSAATPVVAGVVALMLQANNNLTPADVKEILHQTAEVHPDQTPSAPKLNAKWNHQYGYGMVDAQAAVKMATTWPGLKLGQDLDSDGIRDYLDADPRDPNNRNRTIRSEIAPAGGNLDSDGDGVVDDQDGAPLDPDAAPAPSNTTSTGDKEAPGAGMAFIILTMGVAFIASRSRRHK